MVINILKSLFGTTRGEVENVHPHTAVTLVDTPDVAFVDVREVDEIRRTGKLKGALHIPRGEIESRADPRSPAHLPALTQAGKVILYCASGNRSSLAARALKRMGFQNVAHVPGGFAALKNAGAKIEE